MLSVKGTFTTPYRPQSNGLCERMNQTIENIIKCTVRENRKGWDLTLPFVMMAYRATPQSSTGYTPNMLVTGRENNMPCDLTYGTPTSRGSLRNYNCYCTYVEDLRNNLVSAYFRARQCLGIAAKRQKMYYDRDTAPRHFKKGDWVIYWHKPTAMQTLSISWTRPFIVTEKVSIVDNRIQLNPTGNSKMVHVDQLWLDPCHQGRSNWVRDEIDRLKANGNRVDMAFNTDPIIARATTEVSISCQTDDTTQPIIVSSKNTPKTNVRRTNRLKGRPVRLVYYLQI